MRRAALSDALRRAALHCALQELRAGLKGLLDPEEPAPPKELVDYVKAKKEEWALQDPDVVKVGPSFVRRKGSASFCSESRSVPCQGREGGVGAAGPGRGQGGIFFCAAGAI